VPNVNTFIAAIVLCTLVWLGLRKVARSRLTSTFEPGYPYTTPARGILLKVDVYSSRRNAGGVRAEVRTMTIDVEIPGQEPFEVNTDVYFAPNLVRDILPGASVELRINRNNNNQVFIVGLGAGFSGASLVTAPVALLPPPN